MVSELMFHSNKRTRALLVLRAHALTGSEPKGKLGGRQAYAACMKSHLLAWTPESGMQRGSNERNAIP